MPTQEKKRLRILGNEGIRMKGNKKLKLEPCTQSSPKKFDFIVILLKMWNLVNSKYILQTIVD